MCLFCAAIPMSASMGAVIAGKQGERHQQAHEKGEELPENRVPVGKITVAVTGGLVICSAVYHLVIIPHTGVMI